MTYRPAQDLELPEALQDKEKATPAAEEDSNLNLDNSLENADEFEDKLDQARNHEISDRAARGIKKVD